MRLALHLALVVLVVSAGCVANVPDTSPTTDSASQTGPPDLTTASLSPGITCDSDLWVEFWGLNQDDFWSSDTARIGYYLPANTSVLFVTYVDGDVAGTTYEHNRYDDGFNADGAKLDLEDTYEGKHTVQVVAYRDTNGSETFEKGVDEPCRADGALVQAGPTVVDFSRF